MAIDKTALTAALERKYGGRAEVDEDDEGALVVYVWGTDGTMGLRLSGPDSAIWRYGVHLS